ncbi:MAG: hypothetical protein GY854_02035 [Deltaproteobacteria bacterium]|nr:hypothetical protein [Deltaproteobacteria bacterium]
MTSKRPIAHKDLARLLPKEVGGWKTKVEDGLFTADTLFDLIDGGAEVYRALNVQTILSRRYTKDSEPDIIADIFDMGSSSDAFGAFHHDVIDGVDFGIGKESEYLGGNLTFWKDRFFVSVVAFDETDETKRTILALSKKVAKRILRNGAAPGLVKRLPEQGLVKSRVHYFHTKMLLDRFYSLGDENPLGLDDRTEGILARYKTDENTSTVLILVRYPSATSARRARKKFQTVYLDKQKKRGWSDTRIAGNVLICVLDAATKETAKRLVDNVIKRKR